MVVGRGPPQTMELSLPVCVWVSLPHMAKAKGRCPASGPHRFKLGCVVPSSALKLGKPKVADNPTWSVAILAQACTQRANEFCGEALAFFHKSYPLHYRTLGTIIFQQPCNTPEKRARQAKQTECILSFEIFDGITYCLVYNCGHKYA